MKLWKLLPIKWNDAAWSPWYDKVFGFGIAAECESKAREIANANGGDECGPISVDVYRTGGDPWLDPKQSECKVIADWTEEDEGVVLSDFKSA